jgi:hypothetical protein
MLAYIEYQRGLGRRKGIVVMEVAQAVRLTPDAILKWRQAALKGPLKDQNLEWLDGAREAGKSRQPFVDEICALADLAAEWLAAKAKE